MKSHKVRLLILSHISDLLGGAERSMLDTLDYWNEHYDIEPEFILRLPLKGMAGALKERGWKYHALDYTFWSDAVPPTKPEDIFQRAATNNKAIQSIEKIIEDFKPDVVMTNSIVCPWAALAAYFQKVPHVWFVREYGDLDHGRVFEMDRERTFADIGNLSDLVVTNSLTLANHVGQYVDKTKLTTLYTPFKVDEIKQRAQEPIVNPFKQDDSLKLIITGNLAASKGQLQAVQAVGELTKKGYNIELCMVGSGEGQKKYTDAIETEINAFAISGRIHFAGYHKNPMPFIDNADVGIMASRKEAFGRVTFEYLVMGKPVVGANSGATPEMIREGVNGYLYEPENSESLATAIEHYAQNSSLVKKHSAASSQLAIEMMDGQFNADAIHARLMEVSAKSDGVLRQPINYLHRELEYPSIGQEVIKRSGAQSVKSLVRSRLRQKAKVVYYKARSVKAKMTGE